MCVVYSASSGYNHSILSLLKKFQTYALFGNFLPYSYPLSLCVIVVLLSAIMKPVESFGRCSFIAPAPERFYAETTNLMDIQVHSLRKSNSTVRGSPQFQPSHRKQYTPRTATRHEQIHNTLARTIMQKKKEIRVCQS